MDIDIDKTTDDILKESVEETDTAVIEPEVDKEEDNTIPFGEEKGTEEETENKSEEETLEERFKNAQSKINEISNVNKDLMEHVNAQQKALDLANAEKAKKQDEVMSALLKNLNGNDKNAPAEVDIQGKFNEIINENPENAFDAVDLLVKHNLEVQKKAYDDKIQEVQSRIESQQVNSVENSINSNFETLARSDKDFDANFDNFKKFMWGKTEMFNVLPNGKELSASVVKKTCADPTALSRLYSEFKSATNQALATEGASNEAMIAQKLKQSGGSSALDSRLPKRRSIQDSFTDTVSPAIFDGLPTL